MTSSIILKNGKEIKLSEFLRYKYNIAEGKNTVQNETGELFMELMYECAVEEGIKVLSVKERSCEELAKLLEKKGFPQGSIIRAVEKLKDYKYLNDVEYIKNFVMSKRYGRERVIFELEAKGIRHEEIEEFYKENSWIEKENLKYNLEKCGGKNIAQRAGYLARRGFDHEMIIAAVGLDDNEG